MSDTQQSNESKIVRVLESHRGRIVSNEERLAALATLAEAKAERSELATLKQETSAAVQDMAAGVESYADGKVAALAAEISADYAKRDDAIAAALRKEIEQDSARVADAIQRVSKSASAEVAKLSGEAKEHAAQVALAIAELAEKGGSSEWLLEIYKGTYKNGMSAKRGELWTFYGSTFICVSDTNAAPTNLNSQNKSWAVFAASGAPGTNGTGGSGSSLPDQTGNNGKFLTTDGSTASWATLAGGGDLLAANNLSDVASAATAFANIKQAATEAASGVVELATSVETTAGLAVQASDTRLSNARTPTAHKTSHENGGSDEISVAGLSGVLADPQPPIIGATGTTAVAGNDARLTDERVPTAAGLTTKFGTNKASLVDGDKVNILDSAASDAPKHALWSLVKSTLKTYFDTLYQAAGTYLTSGGALGTPSSGNLSSCTNLPASSLTAGTLAANVTLGEGNGQIVLDAALSADGTYSGIIESGTAGATLAFGDLCYFSVTDSRWELTDADAESTAGPVKLGMCVLAAAADGNATTMLLWGKIRADANFPALTVGAPVYVSTTPGDVQTTQPSGTDDVIRIIGYGNTADELFFQPSNDYMTRV